VLKENFKKDIKDFLSFKKFAKTKASNKLPCIVKGHKSLILRQLEGVDIELQKNKAVNLKLAGSRITNIIIKPGETFSFWKLVGCPTKKKGYLDGLTISKNELGRSTGGGLCQLANLIHWLVLNSPLKVQEMYHHTDALFPDSNRRVPFGTGTGVFYKSIDYRFLNNSDQSVQLIIWQENGELCGELRSEKPFNYRYRIVEENHYYQKEGEHYYRNSMVYRQVIRADNKIIRKELVLKNHSRVMYDSSLIPPDQIKNSDAKSML
jgi:vancomycin resistance protein VanW